MTNIGCCPIGELKRRNKSIEENPGLENQTEHDPTLLTLENLLSYRVEQDGSCESLEGFKFLVDKIYGNIGGKVDYKFDKCYKGVSQNLTTSDEAFCLLILENSYEKWVGGRGERGNGGGRYTMTGSNRKNQGWSMNGILRFNEIVENVKRSRADGNNQEVEKVIQEDLTKELERTRGKLGKDGRPLKMRKRKSREEEEEDDDSGGHGMRVYMDAIDIVGV